jgi:hypothetical protein
MIYQILILKIYSLAKKQVFGGEAIIAGMGCQTIAFVRWQFTISILICSFFMLHFRFIGLQVTVDGMVS